MEVLVSSRSIERRCAVKKNTRKYDDDDVCSWCLCSPGDCDLKIPHGSPTIGFGASPAQKAKAAEVFAKPLVMIEKHMQILRENLRKEKEGRRGK